MTDSESERRKGEVRLALIETRETIARATDDQSELVRQGVELGIGPTELGRLAGCSRQGIYDMVKRVRARVEEGAT